MDRSVFLFRISDGALLNEIRTHTGRVYEVHFSQDGNHFLTIGEDRTAKLFKVPYLATIKAEASALLRANPQ